ncbi:MAG: DUF3576 domain-containing protein [Pseudomonadota bacterium]
MAGKFGIALAAVAVLGLGACSGLDLGGSDEPFEATDPDEQGGGLSTDRASRLSDLDAFNFLSGGAIGGGGLEPVNRFLWRASLDTLAFLPLNSTDPFTGVIATDWAASPDAPNERFKVAAYIKNPQLAPSSLQVALFREIREPGGAWVTAPVSGATARSLEDAILVRARQLKIADREG